MESTSTELGIKWDGSIRLLFIIGAVVVCRLWILPLGNSFWLDESVVASLIHNGFQFTVHQAFIDSQPVVFTVIEWLTGHLGDSEIVLRLPSLLASAGSLIVLYRIAREAIDREAGLLAAGVHLSLIAVAVQASNARPYAIALFLEYLSILWLLRWTRQGRFRQGLMWIVCAVFATHLHHLFVTALCAEFLFAALAASRRKGAFRDLLWLGPIAVAGVLPAVPQALIIARQASLFDWVPPATWIQLLVNLVPAFLLVGVGIMAGIAHLTGDGPTWKAPEDRSLPILGILLLFPVIVFFLSAYLGFVNLFVDM